jgi:predicted nucleotidyltransferase
VGKALCQLGLVGFEEPFKNLFTQGMIYYRGGGSSVACAKMSKSKGNVVSPDEMVAKYGADSVRSYVLFMGPAESDAEWNDQGIEGVYRFLGRVWRTVTDSLDEGLFGDSAQLPGAKAAAGLDATRFDEAALTVAERTLLLKTNQVVQKATVDLGQRFRFNTALAALMELSNDIGAARASGMAATPSGKAVLAYAMEMMVRLIEPCAPHMCAELWEMMGSSDIWDAPWPVADERFLTADTIELAVQVNGKVRDRVTVAKDAPAAEVLAAAKALPGVAKYLEGMTLVKEVVVPGRLVSLVVKLGFAKRSGVVDRVKDRPPVPCGRYTARVRYYSGKRCGSMRMALDERLRQKRQEILRVCADHGARNVRVFGSVARGEADEESDIDLIVEFETGTSLLDHAALWLELQELLQSKVDVVSDRGLKPRVREQVLREAIPL